ncbi:MULTISPECIES: FxSxx-COOH cyclophane-containing RiPP peptide [unclassified Streptomyces]|uniref:FxSxx-COOH cyclophane-containing RiPP peptide n=1 Tax=unclassified Streptomyces TaxID=2593676 RepID=UPI0033A37AA5
MDGHVEPADRAGPTEDPSPDLSGPSDLTDLPDLSGPSDLTDLPDLTRLSLAELGTVQHPLLKEVLADLRERARRPSEMLWGWNSSF